MVDTDKLSALGLPFLIGLLLLSAGCRPVGPGGSNEHPRLTGLPTDIMITQADNDLDISAATFSDPDSGAGDVTLTLAVGNGTLAAAGGSGVTVSGSGTAALTLAGMDVDIDIYLDNPGNISYTAVAVSGNDADLLTLTANDGIGGDIALGTVNIDVDGPDNDAPFFTGLDGGATYTEGGSEILADTDVTITDYELDAFNSGNGNYSGADVWIRRQGGANLNDAFSFISAGTINVVGGPNGGGTISRGGFVVARIADVGDNDELQISFENNGTAPTRSVVNEILQAVQYQNTSNSPPANVTLEWTFDDGNTGGSQGAGGALSNIGSATVSIVAVNDDPEVFNMPTDIVVTQETPSDVSISSIYFSDEDSGSADVTFYLLAGIGTLSATSGGGVIVGGSGTLSLSLTGSAADIDTFLNTPSNIQYTGDVGVVGNDVDVIDLDANDGGNTGIGGGTNVYLGSINVDIVP